MSGKSRIVRLIKTCRTACGNDYGFCFYYVKCIVFNAYTVSTVDFIVFYGKICNVYSVEDFNILCFFNSRGKTRAATMDPPPNAASANAVEL